VQAVREANSLSPQLLRQGQHAPKEISKQHQNQQQYKQEDQHSSEITKGVSLIDELKMVQQRLVAIQQLQQLEMQQKQKQLQEENKRQYQQQQHQQQQNKQPYQQQQRLPAPLPSPERPPVRDDDSIQSPFNEGQQQQKQHRSKATLFTIRRPKGWKLIKHVPRLVCSNSNSIRSEGSYGSNTRKSIGNLVHL
jgi:hypothetical protein